MINMFKFKTIRSSLTFWMLCITLIPLIASILIIYTQRVKSIHSNSINKLTAIRDLKVDQINTWVETNINNINTVANDKEIENVESVFFKNSSSAEIEIMKQHDRKFLSNFIKYNSSIYELFIINPNNGHIWCSSDNAHEEIDKSDDSYFTVPMETGKTFIKDVYYSKAENINVMAISTPIYGTKDNTKIVGIVVARINLRNSLYAFMLSKTGMGNTGETLIVNSEGYAVNELRWYDNAPLRLKIKAKPAEKASMGQTGVIETEDYRHEKVLAAYTYIANPGWGFVAKQDIVEIDAPIKIMLYQMLILISGSVILVIFIAFFFASSVAKPISEMAGNAVRMRDGDFSVRNKFSSSNELGTLAKTFNMLIGSIASQLKIKQSNLEINIALLKEDNLQAFCDALLNELMSKTDSQIGAVYILDEADSKFNHFTSVGLTKNKIKSLSADSGEGEFGRVLKNKTITRISDIPEDSVFDFASVSGNFKPKEIVSIPIIEFDNVTAVVSLASLNNYSEEIAEIIHNSLNGITAGFNRIAAMEKVNKLAIELDQQNTELANQARELTEQNIELNTQKTKLDEAGRLKSEFISNMSHELRTPLNSVIGLSGVLRSKLKSKIHDEEYGYLDIIERNGIHLLDLINDILDLSKIEAGKEEIELSRFSIRDTVQSIVVALEPLNKAKSLEVNNLISDDFPKIFSDSKMLHHVLQNLIANAIKFTNNGSIDVFGEQQDNSILIGVKDNGIGISKEHINYIFEEFRQVDGSSSKKNGGTGLGLSIVAKYLKLLKGKIKVESEIEKGSIFTIEIPINISNDNLSEIISPIENKIISSTIKENLTPNYQTSVKNILLIEDSEPAIIQVTHMLNEAGYKTSAERSGKDALLRMENFIPDAVILDLMMPGIDGFEVLDQMRNNLATRFVPVLILTAKHISKDELKKLKANNIHQLIQKGNIDKNLLLSSIAEMLNIGQKITNEIIEPKINQKKIKRLNNGEKASILVIEDNADNMITVKALLEDLFIFNAAENGKIGLEIAKKIQPDLILLDISLPEMDGYEVFDILQKDKLLHKIPVIALTAMAMKSDIDKINRLGFDGMVSKPINNELLTQTIQKWIKVE